MKKPAYQIVREEMFSALVASLGAARGRKVDNEFLRDIKAIHANSTHSDLPNEVRKALEDAVERLFRRLLAEGYTIEAPAS